MAYELPVYAYRTPPEIAKKERRIYPVIIVGAGLAGLTAALELGSRGIETVVLDEDDTVGAQGLSSRGICYAKRSLEILDRFGVAGRIVAKGVTWNEGEVYRGNDLLYRFDLAPESGHKFPAFVNLQQFYVEQYLVERAQQVACVDLRWKNKVTGITPDGHVRVETPDGPYEASAQYVLAADGGHSRVRELLGAQDEERSFYDDRWCIADVKIDTREKAVRKAYLDGIPTEGGAIWYHQMADGVWRTDWQITHLASPDLEATPEKATERLKKLLGERTRFELVWVGPWRFKKRLLREFIHGRVLFLGDAAHEHSPFGARGGNGAIQDANNLGWKLALVLQGRAPAALLATYHEERHYAALDNTENATRSAIFIGPERAGQRLVRNAILDLAQRSAWARRWVNVGRLSVATVYDSSLSSEAGEFEADATQPGAAAADAPFGAGQFIEQLDGEFRTVFFPPGERREPLYSRYGVPAEGATYVFRPDGHVLARCAGIDEAFARRAVEHVMNYSGKKSVANTAPDGFSQMHIDRLYDALSDFFEKSPCDRAVVAQCVEWADRVGSYEAVVRALKSSGSGTELIEALTKA